MVYNEYFCGDCKKRWGSNIAREKEPRRCNKCGKNWLPVKRGPSSYKCSGCGNLWTSAWGGVKECNRCSRSNVPLHDEDSSSDIEYECTNDRARTRTTLNDWFTAAPRKAKARARTRSSQRSKFAFDFEDGEDENNDDKEAFGARSNDRFQATSGQSRTNKPTFDFDDGDDEDKDDKEEFGARSNDRFQATSGQSQTNKPTFGFDDECKYEKNDDKEKDGECADEYGGTDEDEDEDEEGDIIDKKILEETLLNWWVEARKKLKEERAAFEEEKDRMMEDISSTRNRLDKKKRLLQEQLAEVAKEKGSLRAEQMKLKEEQKLITEEKARLMTMETKLKKQHTQKNVCKTPERVSDSDTDTESDREERETNSPKKQAASGVNAAGHREAMKCKEKGDDHRANNQLHAAIEQYTMAIGTMPKNGSFYTCRSVTYMELGMYQDALGDAKKAVDLDTTNIEAHKRYVECLLALGEGSLAERACRQLRDSAPHLPDVPDLLAKAVDIRTLRNDIMGCMLQSAYREASDKLNLVLTKCLQCAELMILKAEVLVHLGQYTKAEEVLSKMNQEDDDNLRFVRALILYKQFKLPEAVKELKTLVTRTAGDAKVLKIYKMSKKIKELVEIAEEESAKEKHENAVIKFTEALEVDADSDTINAGLFKRRGYCFLRLKKYEDAISDYTRTIECDANSDSRVFRHRGLCYTRLSNYEAAMDDYEIAFRLDKKEQTKKILDDVTKKFEEQEAKKTKDYYSALDVPRTAAAPDIKKAFMKLAKLHHPDRHTDASPSTKLKQERRFKLINEAYNTLSDPEKRKKYNKQTR